MESDEIYKYERSKEDISKILNAAQINESELTQVSQILYTRMEKHANNVVKLLELDEHLISTINSGDSISFRGNKDESAVLCTNNKTYDVQEKETSNSWLIVPNLKFFKETEKEDNIQMMEIHNIEGIFQHHYMICEIKPRLDKLLAILEPSSYKGNEYESTIEPDTLYDWNRLRSEIQASDDELRQGLANNMVIEIDGYYRHISFKAEARYVTLMIGVFEENSWELDKVDKEITYEDLKELIIEPIFNCLFHKYTELSDKVKGNGSPLYRYNEKKVSRIVAQILLSASPVTEYNIFMESWRIALPEKMAIKEEYLEGIAIIKKNNTETTKDIVAFLEDDLPINIDQRFNKLFKAKEHWTLEEITPYLLNIVTETMNVNALLTKYTRSSTINGVKYYSSKYHA